MTKIEEITHFRLKKAFDELKNAEISLHSNLFNSSISASYYAIFHAARAVLATMELSAKSHSGVIHVFSENFVKTGKFDFNLNKILTGAFKQRNDSDYLDFYYASKEEAEQQLSDARYFVSTVLSYIQNNVFNNFSI